MKAAQGNFLIDTDKTAAWDIAPYSFTSYNQSYKLLKKSFSTKIQKHPA